MPAETSRRNPTHNKLPIQYHWRPPIAVHWLAACLLIGASVTGCMQSIDFVVDEGSEITLSELALLPDQVLVSKLEGGAHGTAEISLGFFSATGIFSIDELAIAGTEFESVDTGARFPTGTICVALDPDLDSGGTLRIPSIFNQDNVDVTVNLNIVNFFTGFAGFLVPPQPTNSMLSFNISEGPPPPVTTTLTGGIVDGAVVTSDVRLVNGSPVQTPLLQTCDTYLSRVARHAIAGVINARPAKILPSGVEAWNDEIWYSDEKGVHLVMEAPNDVELDAAHLFEDTGKIWFSCNSSCKIDNVQYSAGDIIEYSPVTRRFGLRYSVGSLFGSDRGFETNIDALAVDAQGRLYYSTHVIPAGHGELNRLDPATGQIDVLVRRYNLDNGVVDAVALGVEAGKQVFYLSVNHARSIDFATIIKVFPNDLPGPSEVPEIFIRSSKIAENGKKQDLAALAFVMPRGWDPGVSVVVLDAIRPPGIEDYRLRVSVDQPIQVGAPIRVRYEGFFGDGSPEFFDPATGDSQPRPPGSSGVILLRPRGRGDYEVKLRLRGADIATARYTVQPWGGEDDPSTFLLVRDTERCLTVEGDGFSFGDVGAAVQLDCPHGDDSSRPWARWINEDRGDGSFRLRSSHSGDCLENKGNRIEQSVCDGSNAQAWEKYVLVQGYFHLRSRRDNLCLDILNHSKSNGASALPVACRTGNWTQQWRELAVLPALAGRTDAVALIVRDTSKCLGIDGGSLEDGTVAVQRTCEIGTGDEDNSFAAYEQRFVRETTADGFLVLRSVTSGDCLENRSGSVVQAACNGHSKQKWEVVPNTSGYSRIRSKADNRCLDIQDHNKSDGAYAIVDQCNGLYWTQQWRFGATVPALRGIRGEQLVVRDTGRCLSVVDSELGIVGIHQLDCKDNANNQRWVIDEPESPGFLRLRARHSGLCLQAPVGRMGIVQAPCDDSRAQRWTQRDIATGYDQFRPSDRPTRCIDILNHSKENGAQAVLPTCNNAYWTQQWKRTP